MQHQLYRMIMMLVLLSASLLYGQRTVSGKVMNKEGEALAGAAVQVPNTRRGVITDMDGSYSIQLSNGEDSLKASYLGYLTKTVAVGGSNSLNIILEENVKTLDEVVMIGYGTVAKGDLTGAVESVEPETIDVLQYNDFQSFLQGRAKGVFVQSNSSEPGGTSSITIRGANSLRGNNEPLYVIDGIIVNSSTEDAPDPLSGGNSYLSPQNGLTGLNPQDIERVEVLKDASATAIYGSRGANGVILITTKSGRSGEAKVSYNHYTRVGQAINLYDMLSSDQYVDYQNAGRELQGFPPDFYVYEDGKIAQYVNSDEFMLANKDSLSELERVNWYDDVLRNSFSQNHRLSVSGGGATSSYYLAGGYTQSEGILPNQAARSVDSVI